VILSPANKLIQFARLPFSPGRKDVIIIGTLQFVLWFWAQKVAHLFWIYFYLGNTTDTKELKEIFFWICKN